MNADYSFLEGQLDRLGEQDPLEVLGATVAKLEAWTHEVPDAVWRRPVAEGKWTPAQIVGHLLDVEWIFGFRLRLMLCQDEPSLTEVEQDRWVERLGHAERSPSELVATLRPLRETNLIVWRSLSDTDLERGAAHEGAGRRYTLGFMRSLQAGHDLSHLAQLDSAFRH